MYAVYHGPDGLDKIATRITGLASVLAVGKAPPPLSCRQHAPALTAAKLGSLPQTLILMTRPQ